MKKYLFISLAAIALLAGCAKEASESVTYVLRIGTPETKTSLGDLDGTKRKLYWSNGDQIAVNGNVSNALAGVAEKATVAEFKFDAAQAGPFNILYPASIYKNETTVTIPATQTYVADNIADGVLPMAGYSASGTSASLKYLCAVIKVPLKKANGDTADGDDIIGVSFASNGSEKVCGDFTIDYANATLSGGTGAKITMAMEKALSATDATNIYLVVPAIKYASGFSVTITDENEHEMVQSTTKSLTLEAGHIYNMEEVAFEPDMTLEINIANASQLIAFASAYNKGDYEAYTLKVKLTGNISFNASTSNSYAATGGIGIKTGDVDRKFHGEFNGNNKTISGYTGSVPIFAYTGGESLIKNLTIDESCTFTFTHTSTAEGDFGPVVGYFKGVMQNVKVKANVTLAEVADVASETCLGGIAGRSTEGSMDNCSFSGAITVPAGFSSAGKKIQIGGLIGRISNAKGEVKNSSFSGTIFNQGKMIAPDESNEYKRNPYLMIGGIVGLNSGTITSCTTANHATGITVTLNTGKEYTGTLVTHTENAYNYALGGIAGRNDGTVASCTNNANLVNAFNGGRGTSGNMNGRYVQVGGIAGFNGAEATVSGSNNFGTIMDRAVPKVHHIGGIVGNNNGTVSSCENKSDASIGIGTAFASPYGARMLYAGGVIGSNQAGASVSGIKNGGAINVSRIENTTGITVNIGGVIGVSYEAIDGSTGGAISNSGAIVQSSGIGMCATPTESNDYGLFLGGVVGYTTAGIKSVSNSGTVKYTCTAQGIGAQYVHLGGIAGKVKAASTVNVEKCSNTADVTFAIGTNTENGEDARYLTSDAVRYYYNYLGGIVGLAENVNIKGTSTNKCTNSGAIKGGDGSANNNQKVPSFCVGGIVGYITGTSSISYCALTGSGQPFNDHFSNRGTSAYDCPVSGGIAGQVVGADGKLISVSNCSVESTASVKARRGAVGGIVGAAQYANVTNCTVPVDYTSQSGYFYGGIAGLAQNSTISNCTYSGTTIQSSQIQIGGGIVGWLDAGTSVSGCSSSAATINKNGTAITAFGGIAGSSKDNTAEIASCHYKAGIQICSDANFTDGGGNVADL